MNINDLVYGNPSIEQLRLTFVKNYLDVLFTEFTRTTFPANNSQTTKTEINEIIESLANIQKKEYEKMLFRYMKYDVSVHDVFIMFLQSHGEEKQRADLLIDNILSDITPLIYKLKYYFQRPRPYQLAYFYKTKLFPLYNGNSDSPSYPCGHAIMASVLASVISDKFPKIAKEVTDLATDICMSRVFMGVNYQSDIDYASHIAEKIYALKEFKLKYHL